MKPDTKTAHTPGPWGLVTDTTKLGVAGEIVTRETTIASVNMWEQASNPGAPLANARLIAAAPDMLMALKRAYDTMKDLPDFFEEGSHEHCALKVEAEAIRAAIAKAEGRAK